MHHAWVTPTDDPGPAPSVASTWTLAGGTDDYDARWKAMEDAGQHLHGEADLIEHFRPQSVMDGGCGTGRVAIELHRRGIDVVGVDVDPVMLAAAHAKAPTIPWVESDLATVRLDRHFDMVALPGNVMIFVAPGREGSVVANLAGHLRSDGLLIAGFQLRPGKLDLRAYDLLCAAAGLDLVERWSTWDFAPFDGHDYAVSMHRLH